LKLAATPKHFAVHSGPEALRHHFDARASEKDLRETYLPAFRDCVIEAGAAILPTRGGSKAAASPMACGNTVAIPALPTPCSPSFHQLYSGIWRRGIGFDS
jgi:beta-glucosidase-like glycosyl hydrolase